MNASALLIAALLSAFGLVAGAVHPHHARSTPSASPVPVGTSSARLQPHDVLGGNPTGSGMHG